MTVHVLYQNKPEMPEGDFEGTPRFAVMSAFARRNGDRACWDYERKYGPMVREGDSVVACGPYTARKDR